MSSNQGHLIAYAVRSDFLLSTVEVVDRRVQRRRFRKQVHRVGMPDVFPRAGLCDKHRRSAFVTPNVEGDACRGREPQNAVVKELQSSVALHRLELGQRKSKLNTTTDLI